MNAGDTIKLCLEYFTKRKKLKILSCEEKLIFFLQVTICMPSQSQDFGIGRKPAGEIC